MDKEIVLKQLIDFSKYIKSDVDFQLLSITVKSVMYTQTYVTVKSHFRRVHCYVIQASNKRTKLTENQLIHDN